MTGRHGKPTLAVFLGDTHCGSDTGLALPGFKIPTKQDRPYSVSSDQVWLYRQWQDMRRRIEKMRKTYRIFIGLGGDMQDGVQHHGTTQTSGTDSDQVLMSEALVKPMLALADDALGILGTAAHVGDCGESDLMLYERLHIDSAPFFNLVIGGKRLWWSHSGLTVGSREWTLESSAVLLARDIALNCAKSGIDRPDAIVSHHRHRAFEPVIVRGISVAVTPCWQLPTYYGFNWPFRGVTIGALMWFVEAGKMEIVAYEKPSQERTISASRGNRRTSVVDRNQGHRQSTGAA